MQTYVQRDNENKLDKVLLEFTNEEEIKLVYKIIHMYYKDCQEMEELFGGQAELISTLKSLVDSLTNEIPMLDYKIKRKIDNIEDIEKSTPA